MLQKGCLLISKGTQKIIGGILQFLGAACLVAAAIIIK